MKSIQITQITKDELEELIQRVLVESLEKAKPNTELLESQKGLLNIEEASDFLSLKVPTLYQKVSKREIPFLKRSKRLYFKREDLIQYLEKGRVKSVSEIQEEADNHFKKKGVKNG
ncbi:helix-turn-helix domain-containing protein [Roseivirga pacifica]